VKPNTGFVFFPGEHVGGGYWSTTKELRTFAALWNRSMDVVWKAEFFEEYEGRAFFNPQNEQVG
jgi:hypothetical protein